MFALYVHVPYCTSICPYCDFNVYAPAVRPEQAYVDALVVEMRRAAAESPWRGNRLATLYFGGGTPSLFDPESIRRLIETARDLWGAAQGSEITLEATPESVCSERLARYRAAGVNRLSLGLQSMHPHLLRRLGRVHSPEENRAAVHAARAAGFDNISVDLIYGTPGQTLEECSEDLSEVVALAPEHVSAYALTYEERTPFHQWRARGTITPLSEEIEEEMFRNVRLTLAAGGYEPYEISSFARPGYHSRHNRNYWNGTDYLGLGAGAHSYVAEGWGRRWVNRRNPQQYTMAVMREGSARAESETLTREQAMTEAVFLALRQAGGLDGAAFARRFGEEVVTSFPAVADLCREGLLETTAAGFRLTLRGLLLSDTVFALLA